MQQSLEDEEIVVVGLDEQGRLTVLLGEADFISVCHYDHEGNLVCKQMLMKAGVEN